MKSKWVRGFIDKEPAWFVGLVLAILTLVAQTLSHQFPWATPLPLLMAAITRQLVYSPATVANMAPTAPPAKAQAETGA